MRRWAKKKEKAEYERGKHKGPQRGNRGKNGSPEVRDQVRKSEIAEAVLFS